MCTSVCVQGKSSVGNTFPNNHEALDDLNIRLFFSKSCVEEIHFGIPIGANFPTFHFSCRPCSVTSRATFSAQSRESIVLSNSEHLMAKVTIMAPCLWKTVNFHRVCHSSLKPQDWTKFKETETQCDFHFTLYLFRFCEVQASDQEVFHQEVAQPWNRWPSKVIESPALEIFKTWLDTAAVDLIQHWHESCYEADLQRTFPIIQSVIFWYLHIHLIRTVLYFWYQYTKR